jgi:hypothetical protein
MWIPLIAVASVIIIVIVACCVWRSLAFRMTRDGSLIKCARIGDVAGINTALENGANIDAKTPFTGATAMLIAVTKGDIKMVEALLDRGTKSTEALLTATGLGKADLVALLLNRGADPNTCSSIGIPVLYFAARKRDVPIVRILLAKGADPDRAFTVTERFGWEGVCDQGVCSRVVRQLVKEILESQEQRPCDLCGKTAHGISRDFVIYQSTIQINYSWGKSTTTRSIVTGEATIFLCHACLESRAKKKWVMQGSDYAAQEVMERLHPLPSQKGDASYYIKFGVMPKERWLREVEWSSKLYYNRR